MSVIKSLCSLGYRSRTWDLLVPLVRFLKAGRAAAISRGAFNAIWIHLIWMGKVQDGEQHYTHHSLKLSKH
jgi:hypothetical protein